jgi:CRISPR-associated protein Cas6
MMVWQESNAAESVRVPDDVVDLAFRIRCPRLPVDHAWALGEAVAAVLPWFAGEDGAGLHHVRGGQSANGWQRPGDDAVMHLPRRCRLVLRLPAPRQADARRLCGRTLDVAGFELEVGEASVRPLSPLTTLFSHHVLSADLDEPGFVDAVVAGLGARGIVVRKLLCGRVRRLWTPDGGLATRSLLLADLDVGDSIRIQQEGVGDGRRLGCGLFVPHKSVDAVAPLPESGR